MCKVTVVVDAKTGRLVPFQFKEPYHEIEIISSGLINIDRCVVKLVDTKYIDWDTGYVVEDQRGKKAD